MRHFCRGSQLLACIDDAGTPRRTNTMPGGLCLPCTLDHEAWAHDHGDDAGCGAFTRRMHCGRATPLHWCESTPRSVCMQLISIHIADGCIDQAEPLLFSRPSPVSHISSRSGNPPFLLHIDPDHSSPTMSVEIPKKHKALVYDKPGEISTKIEEIDTPEPGVGEVLINL